MSNSAMQYTQTENDPTIRKKARWAILLAILFWIFVLGIPLFSYTFPLPEKTGILLAFGSEDGGGDAVASAKSEDKESQEAEEGAKIEPEDAEKSQEKAAVKTPFAPIKAQADDPSTILTSKAVKQPSKKVKTNHKAEDSRNIEAEQKAKEEADRQKKEMEEAAARKKKQEEAKKSFTDAFGGSGDEQNPTQQGNENGKPQGSPLDGLISGKADIGTGLADRGVVFEPEINENSQKIGVVVVRICVNAKGKVTEANYTQKGSSTTDLSLIDVAEKAARQYVFSSSSLEKQCGVISIDFKLK